MKRILSVLLITVWISFSEFLRNEILFKSFWINHYRSLGLIFPDSPQNGLIWGVWALCFASCLVVLDAKFSFVQSILLNWTLGFVLMWIVIGNLGVLPIGLLFYAVPLSLLEVTVSVYIHSKIVKSF